MIILFATQLHASCWDKVVPGDYSRALDCYWKDFDRFPDRDHLVAMLPTLFYVYWNQGNSDAANSFLVTLQTKKYTVLGQLRDELAGEYEGAVIFPPQDAKMLFLLYRTDPEDVPRDVRRAVELTVYQQIRTMFALSFSLSHQYGVLKPQEYARALEIVQQMSQDDPYLLALNRYYQGLLLMNEGNKEDALIQFICAREQLLSCLANATEKYWKRRIFSDLAEVDLMLGNLEEAESYYTWILKMDPQDWDAMMNLSYILRDKGVCAEPGIWVEASIKSHQEFYDVVIHCGNIEVPEEELETTTPFPALAYRGFVPSWLS
ncbi:MAG: hypothetical protein C5B54_06920 [Acidobacteria bacterium]|nr:MAG: hypothetical protein C5B54_06920 [Acidobacteriota bacterium]